MHSPQTYKQLPCRSLSHWQGLQAHRTGPGCRRAAPSVIILSLIVIVNITTMVIISQTLPSRWSSTWWWSYSSCNLSPSAIGLADLGGAAQKLESGLAVVWDLMQRCWSCWRWRWWWCWWWREHYCTWHLKDMQSPFFTPWMMSYNGDNSWSYLWWCWVFVRMVVVIVMS